MKGSIISLLVICFLIIAFQVPGQNNPTYELYQNIDTLKFYYVELVRGGKSCRNLSYSKEENYFVNCKKVSKDTYLKYWDTNEKMNDCKPCYVKTYDEDEILLWSGIQFEDMPVGEHIKYYKNGSIKAVGKYNSHGREHGTWIYYKENGEVKDSKIYNNGELTK